MHFVIETIMKGTFRHRLFIYLNKHVFHTAIAIILTNCAIHVNLLLVKLLILIMSQKNSQTVGHEILKLHMFLLCHIKQRQQFPLISVFYILFLHVSYNFVNIILWKKHMDHLRIMKNLKRFS